MPTTKPKTVLFDIDGTVADLTHRRHLVETNGKKEWDLFFNLCHLDGKIEPTFEVYNALVNQYAVVFVSGRPERIRDKTEDWLVKHGFHTFNALHMRADGDFRPDVEFKAELLATLQERYEFVMAFDDRDVIAKLWRDNGIFTFQVSDHA